MGNQIAVNLLVRPGNDVLLEEGCHVYLYELGAMAAWSGALPRVIRGREGRITPEQISAAIPAEIYYMAPVSLLILENTHNHAGGTVTTVEQHAALVERARRHGLRAHLDGARVFNATAALGVAAVELTSGVDTVMFCLSKGLGAPIGSMLCASAELVREARVVRKRMGGGMRQVGVMAAAGLWALEHNLDRLAEDHERARRLARALAESPGFEIDPDTVQTNIVIATLPRPERTERVLEALRSEGILAGDMGPGRVRFVTHLDIDDTLLQRAAEVLRSFELP